MVANVAQLNSSNAQIEYTHKIFEAQKKAYASHPMPSAEERIGLIKRLRPVLLKYSDELCQAVNEDFGNRAFAETKMAEIIPSLEYANYLCKNVKSWMKPSKRKLPINVQPAKARVVYQPKGVVGVITPWNYPLFLAISPMLTALAAGNRVMIKMSEYTPRTGMLLKKLIGEVYSEDQVAVITGEADVGIAFSKVAWDHLLFTGSTSVGKLVMRAAAENLTPVTLELGGKSPAIISDAVPMSDACERIAFGKCFNAGQTCVAPDYILCPAHRLEEFVTEITTKVTDMYPSMFSDDYTSVITDRQLTRLKDYLEDAKAKGARIIEVNPGGEDFSKSRKLPLHLILDVTDDMKVMQDEIFGPLMGVVTYKNLNQALNYVNNRPRPLALYYFDYNEANCEYVLSNTHSGGVCLNDTVFQAALDDVPFGGIGPSGMGEYHGKEGFLQFSKPKGVFEKGKFNAARFIYPPWDKPIHNFLFKMSLKKK